MRAPIVVCMLLASAGCVSTDPEERAAATTTKTVGTTSPAPTAPSATTSTPPTPPGYTHVDPAPLPPPPVPVEKAYSFEGSLDAAACVPSGLDECAGIVPTSKWWDSPADVRILHAKLTLTWASSGPTTDTLRLVLLRATSCGDDCWEGKEAAPHVEGKSPLTLDVDVPALNESEFPIIAVREARLTPEPVYMRAHPDQAFKVEGTLTVLPLKA